MSYILDALKRSDQDRKKGDVPNLHSQPDELARPSSAAYEPSRTSPVLWVILLIAAGLLVWVISRSMMGDAVIPPAPVSAPAPDRDPPAEVSSAGEGTAPVEQTAPDEPTATAEQMAPEGQTAPEEHTAPRQEAPADDEVILDEVKDVRLDFSSVGPIESRDTQVPLAGESTEQPPTTLAAAADVATTDAGATDMVAAESGPPLEAAESGPEASEATSATEPGVQSDPYQGIPHQRELPYDVQDALPDMNISVHLYSANPSSRLVRINNRIFHEGDLIGGELRLEQITPDGLIMIFRDERFWRHAR
jgi:general secretion pathway protein B